MANPLDPWKTEKRNIEFQIERAQTHLAWCREHVGVFSSVQDTEKERALNELFALQQSLLQAGLHASRLVELYLTTSHEEGQEDA